MGSEPNLTTDVTIPDHVLLRRIGGGSYGEVWLARAVFGHYRAVKIVRREQFSDPRPYDREYSGIEKYEPVSREHEGLVDILQAGRNEEVGFFYYVMELADDAATASRQMGQPNACSPPGLNSSPESDWNIEGYRARTLAEEIRERGRLPVAEVVAIGIVLADALEYLHGKGLIHRDIKPANIIFAGGKPKLADVGLVARLDDTMSLVGTIGYMPAEGPGTARADIFSLGKVLYEAATAKDRQDFPALPEGLEPVAGEMSLLELNEVLLRACAPHAEERYSSAGEMAADLKKLQAGSSLLQARVRKRWLGRARLLAKAGLGLAVGVGLMWTITRVLDAQEQVAPGEVPSASVLLTQISDDFGGVRLDTNKWVVSAANWPPLLYTNHFGKHSSRAGLKDGKVVIEATAQHHGGYTTSAGGWLDTVANLRDFGACRVEINLAGLVNNGTCRISMCDGTAPESAQDTRAVTLMLVSDFPPDVTGVKALRHTRVEILLLPEYRAAVVYPDAGVVSQYFVVDLSGLSEWKLRLFASATSSSGALSGEVRLAVDSVTFHSTPRSQIVVGFAYKEPARTPLGGAVVMDEENRQVARTLDNGAFQFETKSWPARVHVFKQGFKPSTVKLVSGDPVKRAADGPVRVYLNKEVFDVGDVVEVIRTSREWMVNAAGVAGTNLYVTRFEPRGMEGTAVFHPVDLENRAVLSAKWRFPVGDHSFSSFAQCGERLLAASVHPGRIYLLDPGKEEAPLLSEPKSALPSWDIDWPFGIAWDGKDIWMIESDGYTDRWGVHVLDGETLEGKEFIPSDDHEIVGLAWDKDATQFWICSQAEGGKVYAFNGERAVREKALRPSMGRTFPGDYTSLAYHNGFLWAFQRSGAQLCKIKIRE